MAISTKNRPSASSYLGLFYRGGNGAARRIKKRAAKKRQAIGVIKNYDDNPCGTRISKRDPFRKCPLLNWGEDDLVYTNVNKKPKPKRLQPLKRADKPSPYKRLYINGDREIKLSESDSYKRSFHKNLYFIGGNSRSNKAIQFIARTITLWGIDKRTLRKVQAAATLFYLGRSGRAYCLYRSLSAMMFRLDRPRSSNEEFLSKDSPGAGDHFLGADAQSSSDEEDDWF